MPFDDVQTWQISYRQLTSHLVTRPVEKSKTPVISALDWVFWLLTYGVTYWQGLQVYHWRQCSDVLTYHWQIQTPNKRSRPLQQQSHLIFYFESASGDYTTDTSYPAPPFGDILPTTLPRQNPGKNYKPCQTISADSYTEGELIRSPQTGWQDHPSATLSKTDIYKKNKLPKKSQVGKFRNNS